MQLLTRPSIQLGSRERFVSKPEVDRLDTQEKCTLLVNDVFEMDPGEFGRWDLGLLNLLCAPALEGSENLDIPRCLERLDHLTAYVKAGTERNRHRFREDPDYGHCEPMWRMALLVTLVKRDFGAAYDPEVRADLEAKRYSPFTDSRNVFIHGLLADDPKRRWGCCSSIPVLVAAIARRLGYPVGLAVAGGHIYARWDNGGSMCFNIEASNAAGMTVQSDEDYRTIHGPLTAEQERSGFYLRTFYPAEEFAQFCKARVSCLCDTGRYAETFLWSARALQFAPDDSVFAQHAYEIADMAIKHRYRQKYPKRPIPPPERNEEFFFIIGEFTTMPERSQFLAIAAHCAERWGEIDKARDLYVEAARQNFFGNNEQRDLQRFLKKYGGKRRTGPLLPPSKDIGQSRQIRLSGCRPEEEALILRRLADQWEREDELLKARDALHDLYLFDPCDAEVFQRARNIERRERFGEQLKKALAKQARRKAAQETKALFG